MLSWLCWSVVGCVYGVCVCWFVGLLVCVYLLVCVCVCVCLVVRLFVYLFIYLFDCLLVS